MQYSIVCNYKNGVNIKLINYLAQNTNFTSKRTIGDMVILDMSTKNIMVEVYSTHCEISGESLSNVLDEIEKIRVAIDMNIMVYNIRKIPPEKMAKAALTYTHIISNYNDELSLHHIVGINRRDNMMCMTNEDDHFDLRNIYHGSKSGSIITTSTEWFNTALKIINE